MPQNARQSARGKLGFQSKIKLENGILTSNLPLRAHNNVVDGNVDELDEEANEAHDGKTYRCCHGNLLVLLPVGLCAALHQSDGIFGELAEWVHELVNLIHYLKMAEI